MKTKLYSTNKFVHFVVFLFSCCPFLSLGQSESNNFVTYDTIVNVPGQTWRMRISRPANMFTPNHPDTASRPVLLVMPGLGEVGTNYNNLRKYGPHYWLENGWDGSIVTGNGKHYPILITIIPQTANPRVNTAIEIVQHILKTYRIKRNSVHLAGISMGGFTLAGLINGQTAAGDETGMKIATSLVLLQAGGQGATSGIMGSAVPYDATGYNAFGRWAAKYGGKLFALEGSADTRNIWMISDNMNASKAGSAYFSYTNIGGGGHCCWNEMFDPKRKNWKNHEADLGTNIAWNRNHPNNMGTYKNGWSVFDWMFRQGDTTLAGAAKPIQVTAPPQVSAGPNQTITLPSASVNLAGKVTPASGMSISNVAWSQVSGPSSALIITPGSINTMVSQLKQGTYVFRLSATDNTGQTSTSQLTITVNAAVAQAPAAPAPAPVPSGRIQVGPGEYQTFFIDKSGTLWGVGSIRNMGVGGGGITGVPQKVSVSPTNTKFKSAAGGLHGGGAVDVNGNVWIVGDATHGQYGNGSYIQNTIANKILTDTTGAPFTNIDTLCPFFYKDGSTGYNGFYAVKTDGSLWVWGRPWKGLSGNGVDLTNKADVTRPMKITIPGNRKVKQIAVGQTPVVLCTDGTVWTWGIGNVANLGYAATATQMLSPHQLTTLSDIVSVAGTWAFWYALKKDGTLYGWGSQGNLMGDPTYPTGSGIAYKTPTVLSNITKHLPAPIAKIQTNFNSTMVLLTNGLLYGWGDNAECNIGNGFLYEHPNPYAWDFQVGKALVKVPYNVGSGKKWKDVWGPTNYGFYWYALDAEDNLYCWGRNKASVLAVQIRAGSATIAASYQDSWNRKWPTLVDPFNQTTSYASTSPYCIDNPSGSPCNSYTIPANTKPKANAGSTQNIAGTSTTLNASASTDNVFIAYYEWKQVSGPNTAAMETPGNPKTIIKNLVKGSYVFRVVVTDNGWLSDSATVTINIGGAVSNEPPVANAGTNQTITLPATGFFLSGSGTDPDGTIEKYAWTKVSGGTATIASPSAAKTNVTGLVAGTYVFRLTVTDDKGATGTATVTITVNAAPNKAPAASAGSSQTITLPTNSVTLNGSGTDSDGTISKYAWTKVSGGAATIASPSAAKTNITGLVQGSYVFRLTVTDDKGATGTANVTITVNAAPNKAPAASAGSGQTITLPTNSVTLNGSGTDSDGTISKYAWTKVSGGTATIASPSAAKTNVTGLVAGTYVFRLTVTDDKGATGTANVTITVNAAPNKAPTASAGSSQTITLPTNSVTLTGSGTDSDGTIAKYAWTKVSGGAATIASPSAAKTNITGLVQGTYVFRLTVTDDKGATGTANVTITVNAAPNKAPTASAGSSQTITLPTNSVTLNGSGTDSDGTIAKYAWTKVSGGTATIASPSAAKTNVTGLVAGTYVFRLTVTDDKGATGTATVTITVNAAPNKAPTASAGSSQTITLPTNSVTLNGNGTDSDGTITKYAWTKVSGGAATIASPSAAKTNITGLVQGTYVFRLTVTDDKGATGTANVTITVNAAPNKAPTASAGSNQTITLPTNSVTLNGSGTDSDGTISKYAWTKVSGGAATIASPSAAKTNITGLVQGTYVFRLTVTDDKGATGTANVTITVNAAPNKAPTASAGSSQTITLPTNSVTLSGSGTDSDGTITKYAWTKVSGGAVTIASPSAAKTNVTGLVAGTYVFRLTVTDDKGATGTATVTITVKSAVPKAPVANAGPDQTITLPANSAQLNAGQSKAADGAKIVSYTWTKVSGPSGTISTPNNAQTNITGLTVEGTYKFRVTVKDDFNNQSSDEVTITVIAGTAGQKNAIDELDIKINPNPVKTGMNLTINCQAKGRTIVRVYDIKGLLLLQTEYVKDVAGQMSKQVDVSKLPSGIFVVQVTVDYRLVKTAPMVKY